ncbi:anti-sigma factor domain-containing protein [Ilumatobacter sp.]|uniref:anti-sigma factor domain-containing protein n=1 Tax=Ilumatobacter sp. TaxID=1967498 RepID=UPI003AF44F8D
MTDPVDSLDEPSDAELAELTALLARAEQWGDPPRTLEDDIVAAIAAEAAGDATDGNDAVAPPAAIAEHRSRRRWPASRLLGAAAAVAVVVAGVAVITRGDDDGGVAFALEGTEAAPDASAAVTVSATPAGLKILLDADGLPGAPDGYMYEAWVGDGDLSVSAGTFHLRGGSGTIELWAGVTDRSFRRLWITLEPIDDDPSSSRDARLRGEFSLPDD